MSVTTLPETPVEPGRRPEARGRGRAVGTVLGLTALALFVGLVLGVGVVGAFLALGYDVSGVEALATPEFLVASVLATQGAMALVGYAYVRRTGFVVPVARPSRRDAAWIAGGLVAALALALAAGAVVDALVPVESQPGSVIGDIAAVDPAVLLVIGAMSVLWVAPAEEYLFRGVVQGRLRRSFGVVAAVGLTSVLFAAIHVFNFTGALAVIVAYLGVLAVVSLVFGYAYERTGNLTVPVAIHAAYNLVLSLLSYVALVAI